MEITSTWMGLIASVLLWWPGWRASQYLRLIYEVKQTAKEAAARGEKKDTGELLADTLQKHTSTWSRCHHGMLLAGFALLFFSYALALIAKYSGEG